MQLENNVNWYGLDKARFTNAVPVSEVALGEGIIVFDLSSYKTPPTTPCVGEVVSKDDNFIVVLIEGKTWEVYESGFGYTIK